MSVIFQPYDWRESDVDDHFVIHIWGHNRQSERVCVRVEDYQPFCRVQLPAWIKNLDTSRMEKIIWSASSLKAYIQWLQKALDDHAPVGASYEPLQNLYMYKSTKYDQHLFPYLTLRFASGGALKHCVNLLNKRPHEVPGVGLVNAKVWETRVSLTHRYVTEQKLEYSAWLQGEGEEVEDDEKISTGHEYIVSWKGLQVVPKETCNSWSVNPLIMSFDIECYSHNHKSFPNKMILEDQITMISYSVKRLYDNDRIDGVIVNKLCDEIPGAEVIVCKNELELLFKFIEIIKKYDPTIITGYNIFRFDLSYIKQRFSHYFLEEFPACGCLKHGMSSIKEIEWESSGTGHVNIAILEAEGRITIDVYTIVKRDYKLDRYTLNHVYKYFMKTDKAKDDVSAKQMFKAFGKVLVAKDPVAIEEAKRENTVVARYAVKDSILPHDLFKELNIFVALIESSCIMKVPLMTIFTAGQQIRMQNQLYQVAYHSRMVIDERKVDRPDYEGGFVVEPEPGQYQNVVVLDFASLYPSIVQAYNICYTTLVDDHMDLPDNSCHIFEWEDGATGRKVRTRFVKKEIREGILPQLCKNLVVERKAVRKMIKPENDPVLNTILDQRQKALKVSANSIYGAFGMAKGRLPLLEGAMTVTYLGRILNEVCRNYVAENTTGKVVYGDTDSIMVDFGLKNPYLCDTYGEDLSAKITATLPSPLKLEYERGMGRMLLLKKKMYGGVELFKVYRDNDEQRLISCTLAEWDPYYENVNDNLYRVEWLDKKKNKVKVNYITLDKSVDPQNYDYILGCPVGPGGKYDQDVIIKKGVVGARRDRCLWVRKAYLEVFTQLLFQRTLEDCGRLLDQRVQEFMSRQVELLDLVATAEVGIYKETCTHPMRLFKEEMKRKGKPLQVGERIDYLVVKTIDGAKKKGYKMRTFLDFVEGAEIEPFDYEYCLDRSLGQILIKMLIILFGKVDNNMQIRRTISPKRAVKMIRSSANPCMMNDWMKRLAQKRECLLELRTKYWKAASCDPRMNVQFLYENLERLDLELIARYGPLSIIQECPEIAWNLEKLSANPNLTQDYVLAHRELAWNIGNLVRNPNVGSHFLLQHGLATVG